MPKAKTTKADIKVSAKKTKDTEAKVVKPVVKSSPRSNLFNQFKLSRKIAIVAVVLGLLILAYLNKSFFVAATVNGMPITNIELLNRMNKQFREQTLNQMVNEKIIFNEARKNGVTVSKEEIDGKISELEQNVGGGQMLDSLLSQQGQSREDLRTQIRIQLLIEKLYSHEATTSAQEVEDFVKQNPDQLTSTDSAKQREEAESILKQQKLSDIFATKFKELKDAASVKIFK